MTAVDEGLRVRLAGDLTVAEAAAAKATLIEALESGERAVTVELSEVTELDTAGLQVLLLARRMSLECDVALSFDRPSEPVRNVLAVVHLDDDLSPRPVTDGGAGR